MSLRIAKISFSIPAGQTQEFELVADFYRLETFPSGLLVGLNGGAAIGQTEKFSHQGIPGQGEVQRLRFENPTGGTLAGAFLHGTGQMDLTGTTSITGSVPLPAGASTAAGQTSIIGVLTSLVSIVSTATLQSAGNTILSAIQTALATANSYLSTLANSTASLSGGRTPRVAALTAGATFSVIYARELSVLNTHSSLNLTVRISGQTDFVLTPGRGVSWPLLDRRDSYAPIDIDCPASGSGTVSYVL